ncbi:MAG TPA: PAS domain S-box protein, partial [Steroidobacteraceae bacterium]|nr:PAS domain S-box protein [Steroidobacteraceae bacterium]
HPQDLETDWSYVRRLAAGEIATYSMEKRYLRPDQSVVWANLTVSLLRDPAGLPEHLITVIEDITERKQTQERLCESEERLRNLVRQSSAGIAEADTAGRLRFVNDRYCALLGYTREELVGRNVRDVTHPDDVPRDLELLERCVRQGEPFEIEKRYIRKDGAVVWVRNQVVVLRAAEGTPAGVAAISEDITPRRSAEERLKEETRVREILGEVSQALVAAQLDIKRVVQTVTDAATQVAGAAFGAFFYNVTDEQGESMRLYTLSGVSREAFARFPQPRNTAVFGPTFRGEGVLRSSDITADPRYGHNAPYNGMPGGHLPVRSYLAVPVKTSTGNVIGGLFFGHPDPGVFTGRTERLVVGIAAQAAAAFDNARLHQEAQQEIRQRKRVEEALSEADRRKDEFLAMLAHELRNPLAPISSAGEILSRTVTGDERARTAIEMIKRQASHLTRLVDDLLDVSRITQGRIQLQRHPLDLASVIAHAVESVEPQMRARNHRLSVVSESYESLYVNGDYARLTQCVVNVLTNAAKYTDSRGQIRLQVRSDGEYAAIAITDSGIGIAPELLPKVFDLFVQSDRTLDRAQRRPRPWLDLRAAAAADCPAAAGRRGLAGAQGGRPPGARRG